MESSAIPVPLRQPVTLAVDVSVSALAQAAPHNENDGAPSRDCPSTEAATEALAKAAQNPIANLISLPFLNNTNICMAPGGQRTQNVLSIQPVISVPLSKDLLLVTRTIVPVVDQPTSATGNEGSFGLGDINPQFSFVPQTNSNITWGVGPTFLLPTATQSVIGLGKWRAGPSGVELVTTRRTVLGALANNVWSFAGASDRTSVNQFLHQPFFNDSLSKGWYLVASPIITANWQAANGVEKWTLPIGGGVGCVFGLVTQKVNASWQAFWNVVKSDSAGNGTLRAQFPSPSPFPR